MTNRCKKSASMGHRGGGVKNNQKGLTYFMDSPLGGILKSCFNNCFVPLLVRFKYVPALTNG